MRRPLFLFLFLLLGVPRIGTAQYSAVPDVNDPVHVFLERQASLGNIPHSELASLPLSRFEIGRILDSLQVLRPDLSRVDRQALDYFTGQVDHRGRPLRRDDAHRGQRHRGRTRRPCQRLRRQDAGVEGPLTRRSSASPGGPDHVGGHRPF